MARNMKAIFSEFVENGVTIPSLRWPQYQEDARNYYRMNDGRCEFKWSQLVTLTSLLDLALDLEMLLSNFGMKFCQNLRVPLL